MPAIDELIAQHVYLTFDDVLLQPNYSEVTPPEVALAVSLSPTVSLNMPILSAPMDTVTEAPMAIALGEIGGLGIIHRNLSVEIQVQQLQSALERGVHAGAAVGIGKDFMERVMQLAQCQPTALCVDSAHGHTKHVMEAVRYIKKAYPQILLLAGNVVTYEGAKALFESGADAVKVGVGPGSICTTRIVAGIGVPQLSAIAEASRAAREYGKHIIADGGIRTSGDIVKALAAGASLVMLGSLMAGTEEAPGIVIEIKGQKYKRYRGMGSVGAMVEGSAARYGQESLEGDIKKLVPEGIEGLVEYRGSVKGHVHQLLGGLRAGCAYLGAATIAEMRDKAQFIRITSAGMVESYPHTILAGRTLS